MMKFRYFDKSNAELKVFVMRSEACSLFIFSGIQGLTFRRGLLCNRWQNHSLSQTPSPYNTAEYYSLKLCRKLLRRSWLNHRLTEILLLYFLLCRLEASRFQITTGPALCISPVSLCILGTLMRILKAIQLSLLADLCYLWGWHFPQFDW